MVEQHCNASYEHSDNKAASIGSGIICMLLSSRILTEGNHKCSGSPFFYLVVNMYVVYSGFVAKLKRIWLELEHGM